jgi:ubiquinone/menaquinone biosynthesis C-methylase UbiE
MDKIDRIYNRRFGKETEFRNKMYKVLCSHFFQKYVPEDSTVLDVAAGYCEFINNIKAKRKIALDINPDTSNFAQAGVEVIKTPSTDMHQISSESVDVVFVSNFFEHLTKEDIAKTIKEINRVLKKGGRFLMLQPNIRYCYKDYWMFFDHITALDDRSIIELLEINGFNIIESRPKFLPFTTKGKLPKSLFLLKVCLKLPVIQKLIGAQAFIYAKKS